MYFGTQIIDGNDTGRPIGYQGEAHALIIGPTRSGKSRRLLIPNLLLETARSMLVVDIKGELTAFTAGHRAAKGGKVVALDPFGELVRRGVTVPRTGFNPMVALDPKAEDFVDDATELAEALVQVTPNMKEAHFAESAQELVAGMAMLVRCFYGERAHLGIVRDMLAKSAADLEIICRQAVETPLHPAIANKLSKFTKAGDNKEIASIISTAQTQTRFLDSPGIRRNLAGGGLDFGTLKTDNRTVYLVLPPKRVVTHAKWLRLVIGAAMSAMQRTEMKPADRLPVVFMLDEFPQLGRLQSVETAVSLNAGYGVRVWAAVQHLGQLKEHYGDNWETFVSAGAVTSFAPRDYFTRDYMTKQIGTGTRETESTTHGQDGSVTRGRSVQKDDLMPSHKWQEMAMGQQWALIPTNKRLVIANAQGHDFTTLPGVVSGAIRPGAW